MKIIDCTLSEFLTSSKKIILFGTGLTAEAALREPNLAKRVVCCADNDGLKQGKVVTIGKHGYTCVSPESLKSEDFSDKCVLIASTAFDAIAAQLSELDCEAYIYPLIRLNFADEEDFFERRILRECLKEYNSHLKQIGIDESRIDELVGQKRRYIKGDSPETRPFVIPRTMIMPTTRCNMRCRDCSSLLPLFIKPEDIPLEKIISDLTVFFSGIDECVRMTIGGEPFLYPHTAELLKYLIAEKKLLSVMLITNSTIMPSEKMTELLRHEKVFVEVSDYGHIEKMSRLVSHMEKNAVRFAVLTNQSWYDMGGTECRGRTTEALRRIYLSCEQGLLIKGVHNGRFHTCARSARLLALGAYESERDYFALSEADTPLDVRRKLKKLYYSESADACNHCDLGSFACRKIPAGVQLTGNFRKSAYTIVERAELERLRSEVGVKEAVE